MNPVSSDETPTPHTDGLRTACEMMVKAIGDLEGHYIEYPLAIELARAASAGRAALTSSSSSQPQVTRENKEAGAESTDTRGSKEEESFERNPRELRKKLSRGD